jgi:murein tripeptide amidase MpaA
MKRLPLAIAAALCLGSLAASAHPGDAEHRALRQLERQQTGLYRAYFPDAATGRQAAISYHANLLESNWRQGYLVFELDGPEIEALQGFGFRVLAAPDVVARRNRFLDRIDAAGNGVQAIPGYECYETVEETFAAAEGIAAAKPQLASWSDVGDSWNKTQGLGGYDLKVLKLTNAAVAGAKPRLFINAAIHAREYTTAPLVLAFARWLADGHGVDADATWILDHHEVHLLLQTNPDGRKKAEAGLSWRKNTNTDYCAGNNIGADLNRNFTFQWNSTGGVGSSGNPCDLTYRGPAAASEPETQAIEAYIRALWPDRRGPGLNDAAPADTSGIHLDIHSYSELVLWPWGATNAPAPNGAALQTLGRRFAWFNGYTPTQSIGLYPTDGTSDGPSYGELGVAAYTFELGTSFFQSCSVYNNTVKPDNLPALIYAAKVVRTPYLTPGGPEALAVTVPPVPSGATATLTASITDTRFNQGNGAEAVQAITGADAYIGTPPWLPGAVAIPLSASDGSFNSSTESVTGALPSGSLADGRYLVYVVGRDASGASGPVSAAWLDVGAAPPAITLALSKTPGSRRSTVNLAWDGADGRRVDIYRNGALLLSTRNDGAYSQRVPAGNWTYRVCEQGSVDACSAEQGISTP